MLTIKPILLLLLLLLSSVHCEKKRRKGSRPNFKKIGIKASKAGDHEKAVENFRKFVVIHPDDSSGYNNLGVALMRQGVENDDIRLLQQSEQAFRASVDISGPSPSTQENLKMVDQYLTDRGAKNNNNNNDGGNTLNSDGTEVDANGDVVSPEVQRKQKHEVLRQRINSACQERQLRIKARSSDHKAGRLSAKKMQKAQHLLKLCGVVIIERLFEPEFMDEVMVAQNKVVDRFLDGVEQDPTLTNSTWSEQRSPGRYELLSPMEPPFTSEELLYNPLLLPLMQNVLDTRRIEVDTHSSVTSMGKYSKRRRSNVAVIIVRIVRIISFLFYCISLLKVKCTMH